MTSVFDVVKYLLKKHGPLNTVKLQKLVYYCQAWSLVWDEKPLFKEPIEAWASGPVAPALFFAHQGQFKIDAAFLEKGNALKLTQTQKETIDAVWRVYGKKTAQWLVDLTHAEDPWKNARKGIPQGVRSHRSITLGAMQEYYSGLI